MAPDHSCCRVTSKASLVRDPVCGMEIDPARAERIEVFQGRTYHSCSWSCGENLRANPEKYVLRPRVAGRQAVNS